MESFIHWLDLIGTAVFAITGALAAGRKQMDMFGVVMLATVTAVGGGTIRDIILGIHPVFWVQQNIYIGITSLFAIATFVLAHRTKIPAIVLLYADAVGLAVFTVIGFQKTFEATELLGISVLMGMATGVFGGVIRDLLSNEIPLIFRHEIYAFASLCGAVVLVIAHIFSLNLNIAIALSITTTLLLRLIALRYDLSLPQFMLEEDKRP